MNNLAPLIQANPDILAAVSDVAARKITLEAIDDNTTFTVGLRRQGIQHVTTVTIGGAESGAGEQYSVIINWFYSFVGVSDKCKFQVIWILENIR